MAYSSSRSPIEIKARILTLPPELIEQILILAALYGFPSAIAQFGCTCSYFHQLVYRSTDNHLWREVFLTTFDDPRLVLGRINSATTFSPGKMSRRGHGDNFRTGEVVFNWGREFIRRIDAMRIMKKYKDLGEEWNNIETNSSHAENPSPLSRALRSLLSVLETAHPFPAQRSQDVGEPPPTFPPILTAHASSFLPSEIISSNALWLHRVVRFSCPQVLIKRFLATSLQRRRIRRGAEMLELDAATWDTSEEAQLFHQLVFLNGFAPFSDVLSSSVPEQLPLEIAAAREVSRSKVYNLRYLTPDRSWGPFLPAGGVWNKRAALANPDFEELSRGILGLGDAAHDRNGYLLHIVADREQELINQLMGPGEQAEDGDYVPSEADDSDSDNGVYDEDEIRLILSNGQQPDSTFVPPKPHQVVPDYGYLSAARLLVEMNLREVLVLDNPPVLGSTRWNLEMNRIVDAFGWLQFVRMGGAPGFWESWMAEEGEDVPSTAEEGMDDAIVIDVNGVRPDAQNSNNDRKETGASRGKGKAKDTEAYQGWDWAGAAGEWKRAVCWLDYRDLLRKPSGLTLPCRFISSYVITAVHNLTGFPSESLEETVRVFPMTLRVSGYSPPPDPEPHSNLDMTSATPSRSELESLVYTLPVIHLEGESRGSDIDPSTLRHVKGTVRMLADGAVRWSLTSSFPGNSTPEWVTESVQVGAIGSVVGIIGMWTGAEHASTDPLGPTWAWKVG